VRLKFGGIEVATPVPVSDEVCGEPDALSAMLSVAVAAPADVGVKTTEIVQFAPAASELPQLFVSANTLAFAPERVMPVIVKAALPVLVRVAVCAALLLPVVTEPKASVAGVNVAAGAVTTDVPSQVKVIDCWGMGDGKLVPRFAVKAPAVGGTQVTAMEQLAPAARLAPQLLVWLKEPGSLPKKLMLVIDNAAFPVLLRVAVWALLWLPTVTLPKARF
jgi:hypothetical protein